MTARRIVVLPGDGIGPEVTEHALAVLERSCERAGVELQVEQRLIGGAAIESEGRPLSDETVDACRRSDAVLLGAVGGPRWDHLAGDMRCESGLLRLRKELGVFANLRPVRVHPALAQRSTLKPEVIEGVDMLVVRELTGGVYFGLPRGREGSGPFETARDSMVYTRAEIERVTRVAFELARGRRRKLTSVDKQNVLVSSRLWRDVVTELAAEYPDVELEHQLVDACAMRLIRDPRAFDVVVTENLFGDILTDEAAMLTGSLGMLPSASLGEAGDPGLYEPIHGSAPDIAGKGAANPLGAILCVAMMLRLSLQMPEMADAVEAAVDSVVQEGTLTADLGGSASTAEVADAVLRSLSYSADAVTV
ncbi:MAG: 3-isopropylmalate dehydrogenase [Candidatus Dormibacteria bacterium]